MARKAGILAGLLLALASHTTGRTLSPVPALPKLASTGNDLISFEDDDIDIPDETPIIKTSETLPMQPLRQTSTSMSTTQRLSIAKEHTLYWGGRGRSAAAQLQINMPNEKEGVLNTEDFDDLLDSVTDCPREGDGQISMSFLDGLDFRTAHDVWKWVNVEPTNEFLLVVGSKLCGWNDERILYHVNDVDFTDDGSNTLILNASATTWKNALHTFDLQLGEVAAQSIDAKGLRSREAAPFNFKIAGDDDDDDDDDDDGFNIPLDANLTTKGMQFSMNGIDFIAYCKQVESKGNFHLNAHFSMDWFELDEAAIDLSTEGIETTAIIDLSLKGRLTDKIMDKSLTLFKFGPAGLYIPGIITIGPTVNFDLTAEIYSVKGAVRVTTGGTAIVPPSTARLDFLSEDGCHSEGWEASFTGIPFELDFFIELWAQVAINPSINLEISALGNGFIARLSAETPALLNIIRFVFSPTCTACDIYSLAAEATIAFAGSMTIALKKLVDGDATTLWGLSFFDIIGEPIASMCEPLPGGECNGNNGTQPAPPNNGTLPPPPPPANGTQPSPPNNGTQPSPPPPPPTNGTHPTPPSNGTQPTPTPPINGTQPSTSSAIYSSSTDTDTAHSTSTSTKGSDLPQPTDGTYRPPPDEEYYPPPPGGGEYYPPPSRLLY